jgi:hypothetical protein
MVRLSHSIDTSEVSQMADKEKAERDYIYASLNDGETTIVRNVVSLTRDGLKRWVFTCSDGKVYKSPASRITEPKSL